MTENERQQRIVERIYEDERLRGDLEDDAATPLLAWAAERAGDAAADPARPDEAVEEGVRAVRAAVRAAAGSGETEPTRLIALAEAELRQRLPQAEAAPSSPAILSETQTEVEASAEAASGSPPEGSPPSSHIKSERSKEAGAGAAPANPESHGARPPKRQDHRREAVETVVRQRRKRSRLAGYLKHARGGRR
jgi:hypothetical protein